MESYKPDVKMVQFWSNEVAPLIMPLFNSAYSLTEIQSRYLEDLEVCRVQYSIHNLNVELHDKPPRDTAGKGTAMPFGCSIANGKPSIHLFVREIKKVSDRVRRICDHDYLQCFETLLVVGVMHELDHLVVGKFANQRDRKLLIEDECVVHARTCERTMIPLVQIYGRKLLDSDLHLYNKWLECNRNAQSQQWKDFIAGLYGNLNRG